MVTLFTWTTDSSFHLLLVLKDQPCITAHAPDAGSLRLASGLLFLPGTQPGRPHPSCLANSPFLRAWLGERLSGAPEGWIWGATLSIPFSGLRGAQGCHCIVIAVEPRTHTRAQLTDTHPVAFPLPPSHPALLTFACPPPGCWDLPQGSCFSQPA